MDFELDPSLMQDFLTETGELIEQMDGDLVRLESVESADERTELLNSIFRALHTVKGSAGFLKLDVVIRFSHVAEDALNRLRKGEVEVTAGVIDALLQSSDVLRGMTDALVAGDEPQPCPESLMGALRVIADTAATGGGGESDGVEAGAAAEPEGVTGTGTGTDGEGVNSRTLEIPDSKRDLLSFMVDDLVEQCDQIDQALDEWAVDSSRSDAAANLVEVADSLSKTTDFFELDQMVSLVELMGQAAGRMGEDCGDGGEELAVRVRGMVKMLRMQGDAMLDGRVLEWPVETLVERLTLLISGDELETGLAGAHGGEAIKALALDGVTISTDDADGGGEVVTAEVGAGVEADETVVADAVAGKSIEPTGGEERRVEARRTTERRSGPAVEQTIRVEVGRLERLMNLVGQLVLNKNRFLAITRKLRDYDLESDFAEEVSSAANDMDRLTSNLQVGVMRTRMQPLSKLFDRYPRVIRDIARTTGKQIDLEIQGGDTEVDKSVLELLGDPLVHILRNSADHGVELPEKRVASGKAEKGVIRLQAEHQGGHVRVAIVDDGKGLDRDVLGRKAVEKGLVNEEQLAGLSNAEVYQFIFAAGFSTADQVSDLSGRGVGMDVVRTNVQKMSGTITVDSQNGKGTTIEILIPLTVAIMPAMVVSVAEEMYCIPLQCVVEIVRPEASQLYSVSGRPVMRLRDLVLPLIDLRARLEGRPSGEGDGRFAVVITVGTQRVGVMVDGLVGQQEIVIKPLKDRHTQGGPFSGATIMEDGRVSLILDVVRLTRGGCGPERDGVEREAA